MEHVCLSDNTEMYYYDYKRADYDSLNHYISRINWDYEFSFVFTTEKYWDIFLMHLTVAIDLFVPLVRRKVIRLSNRKTYPRHLRNMLNRKALLWKNWRLSTLTLNKRIYKSAVLSVKNALTLYLRNKEIDIISSDNIG